MWLANTIPNHNTRFLLCWSFHSAHVSDYYLENKSLPWDYQFKFVIDEISNVNDKTQVCLRDGRLPEIICLLLSVDDDIHVLCRVLAGAQAADQQQRSGVGRGQDGPHERESQTNKEIGLAVKSLWHIHHNSRSKKIL